MFSVTEGLVFGWRNMPLAWLLPRAVLQQRHPALG